MSGEVAGQGLHHGDSSLAPPSGLPPEWVSWVEVNLGRNPFCGANLLLTLLDRGFDPLASLEAIGDVSLDVGGEPAAIDSIPICVLIASYRDPDCGPTLVDLFRQARHPERVTVAVVSQEEKEDRLVLPAELKPFRGQITVRRKKASASKGVCWARHHGQKLLQSEPFALQLDSHMRFEPGWDLLLLATWLHCRDARALLTTYPAGFCPDGVLERGVFHGMAAKQFDPDGILLMAGKPCFGAGSKPPERPMAGAFISANFLFGPSSFVKEVPYDPGLYFFGEEISLAVRLWTHGFNIFHPNRAILYHDWDRGRRSTHFQDHQDWTSADRSAKARVRALLGVPPLEGDPSTPELAPYGLGAERSLADYEQWSGVSFAERSISASAEQGLFPPPPVPAYGEACRVVHADASFVVVDDFLPEEQYLALREFLVCADYRHINSNGLISRAWHLQDRFPLRSEVSWIQMVDRPAEPKPAWVLPTGQPIDGFMRAVEAFQQENVPWIGRRAEAWDQFSATAWIYPPGTGLAMHTDGSNVYSGAYVYFLNESWRSHWGGLLLVMDQQVNQHVADCESRQDGLLWYRRRWLHENQLEELMLEAGGMGRVVFPKANRIVYLANNAHHMVTRVNEEAGDCVRLSLAGFFSVRRG